MLMFRHGYSTSEQVYLLVTLCVFKIFSASEKAFKEPGSFEKFHYAHFLSSNAINMNRKCGVMPDAMTDSWSREFCLLKN